MFRMPNPVVAQSTPTFPKQHADSRQPGLKPPTEQLVFGSGGICDRGNARSWVGYARSRIILTRQRRYSGLRMSAPSAELPLGATSQQPVARLRQTGTLCQVGNTTATTRLMKAFNMPGNQYAYHLEKAY
jgi:hypothetical protein